MVPHTVVDQKWRHFNFPTRNIAKMGIDLWYLKNYLGFLLNKGIQNDTYFVCCKWCMFLSTIFYSNFLTFNYKMRVISQINLKLCAHTEVQIIKIWSENAFHLKNLLKVFKFFDIFCLDCTVKEILRAKVKFS